MLETRVIARRMINWKFKCLDCGYSFVAIEPKELYDAYTSCTMCSSKKFKKDEDTYDTSTHR